ncbi:glycoside hydrolase family 55 protein [Paenibacillus sp. H1-7]|uniref:glycoside hydrolase family 55 protein n=1 Tax=Paenibacillus sp. H1-7 TaxID=2282849 RepID=UPI001EF75D00|nr:glycoside hydrolase family 55 protein [Paenibacillus sp. H1-7]
MMEENKDTEVKEKRISRREVLTAIGMTGAAAVTGALLNNGVAHALSGQKSVSEAVYGSGSSAQQLLSIGDADDVTFLYAAGLTGRTVGGKLREWISVKDFGAAGDGVTDDSAAFQAAIAYAESKAVTNPGPGATGSKLGRVQLFVPPGSYVITQPESLLRSSYTTSTVGLQIQGAGQGVTQIIYNPAATGTYLAKNNNAWLFCGISDIEFYSNSSTNHFMYSYSTGQAQSWTFERIRFRGKWGYTFHLEGTDTNSEMTWREIDWAGYIAKGVYVPAATGSDQFLNYNFYSCNFEVQEGDFLHFEKGGNINVWGGSFIHIGANAGTFFKLLGSTHSYGVERFLCIGARMEHRNANSKLIYCEWSAGIVSFINVDTSSSVPLRAAAELVATFYSNNTKMPVIKFDNCRLLGKHEYMYRVNSFQYPHNIRYENCEINQHTSPSDFIVFTAEGGNGNAGGTPTIHFTNTRGQGDPSRKSWECDYGFQKSSFGITKRTAISVKRADGKFPYSASTTVGFTVPVNARIVNIWLQSPAGAVSSTGAATFTVQTTEATPTVLATLTAANHSQGFMLQQDLYFRCDTAEKCSLQLVAGSNVTQANPEAECIVEYIG